MNNQDAKFILRAYRPGGADAGDATFGEAVEQARRDPELGRWFAREQGLDGAVAAKLRAVAVPAGLRESILTGARVSELRPGWWRQPAWLAAAASVALILATAWAIRLSGTVSIDRMTEFAVADLHNPRHGAEVPSSRELAATLADPAMRLAAGLPFSFDRLATMGCRTLRLGRHNVLETCFRRGSVEFHLYVMKRGEAQQPGTGPEFAEKKGLSTMAWADASYIYVVASASGVDQLKALL